MKKTIPCRFAMLGTALILSTLTAVPAFAASHSGHLDTVSEKTITGWAWDSAAPGASVTVELTIAGESLGPTGNTVVTVSADQSRSDLQTALGSAAHGFVYEIDWTPFSAGTYTVTAAAVSGDTKTPLIGTHTYKKEETPVIAAPVISAETPAADSAQTPSGPTVDTAEKNTTAPIGPGSSATMKPAPAGPGDYTPPSNKKSPAKKSSSKKTASKTYGPGAPVYETGEADQFLGTFKATAYCGCDYCSGGHALTYSGTVPKANHTIAADLNLYPLGTKLMIDDIVYTVEDKGSSVVDNKIDIYFETHAEALAFGLKNVDVYSVK